MKISDIADSSTWTSPRSFSGEYAVLAGRNWRAQDFGDQYFLPNIIVNTKAPNNGRSVNDPPLLGYPTRLWKIMPQTEIQYIDSSDRYPLEHLFLIGLKNTTNLPQDRHRMSFKSVYLQKPRILNTSSHADHALSALVNVTRNRQLHHWQYAPSCRMSLRLQCSMPFTSSQRLQRSSSHQL